MSIYHFVFGIKYIMLNIPTYLKYLIFENENCKLLSVYVRARVIRCKIDYTTTAGGCIENKNNEKGAIISATLLRDNY